MWPFNSKSDHTYLGGLIFLSSRCPKSCLCVWSTCSVFVEWTVHSPPSRQIIKKVCICRVQYHLPNPEPHFNKDEGNVPPNPQHIRTNLTRVTKDLLVKCKCSESLWWAVSTYRYVILELCDVEGRKAPRSHQQFLLTHSRVASCNVEMCKLRRLYGYKDGLTHFFF